MLDLPVSGSDMTAVLSPRMTFLRKYNLYRCAPNEAVPKFESVVGIARERQAAESEASLETLPDHQVSIRKYNVYR